MLGEGANLRRLCGEFGGLGGWCLVFGFSFSRFLPPPPPPFFWLVFGSLNPGGCCLFFVAEYIWVWVKIKPSGDRRFWSFLLFTRVPFWVPIPDPQPFWSLKAYGASLGS